LSEPPHEIDENTHEAITSVTIDLVLKGILIPPISNAKIIKTMTTTFNLDQEFTNVETEDVNPTAEMDLDGDTWKTIKNSNGGDRTLHPTEFDNTHYEEHFQSPEQKFKKAPFIMKNNLPKNTDRRL
jgi:hypothetical protein